MNTPSLLIGLMLSILFRGCPGYFSDPNDVPHLETSIEITRLAAPQQMIFEDCGSANISLLIRTIINGFELQSGDIIHDLSITSPTSGPVTVTNLGGLKYSANGLTAGNYTAAYTIKVREDFSIPQLRGLTIPVRKTFLVENPERLDAAHFDVRNASCEDCADGRISLDWSYPVQPSFIWSTGESTSTIRGLKAGLYKVTFSLPGLQTCDFVRQVEVHTNAPVISDDELDLTRCEPSRVTPSYPLVCDSLGMPGMQGGYIDFKIGKLQFADLALESYLQFEFEMSNRGPDDWQTIYRLSSSHHILSEGNLALPPPSEAFGKIPLRISLLDFVRAGGFDIDLSLRIFVRDDLFLKSMSWRVFEAEDAPLIIQTKAEPTIPVLLCQSDTKTLGPFFAVSGGSTPYRYYWALNGDAHYIEDLGSNPVLPTSSEGQQVVGLRVVDANGTVAETSQLFQIHTDQTFLYRLDIDSKFTSDSMLYMCTEDDILLIDPYPTSETVVGPGVSNNIFNPQVAGVGLHTLQIGSIGRCKRPAFLNILVQEPFDPSWEFPDSMDCGDTLQLDGLVLGDTGGLWYLDGHLIEENYLEASKFRGDTVQLSYGFGGGSCNRFSTQDVFLTCNFTSTHDVDKISVKIYPNPITANRINIKTESTATLFGISILNTIGECVYQQEELLIGQQIIDVSSLTPGIYLIRLRFKSGFETVRRFIVPH